MTKIFGLGVAIALVAACAESQLSQSDRGAPPVITSSVPSIESRLSGKWMLVRVNGSPVASHQLVVTFTARAFEALINCNKASADYAVEGNSIIPDRTVTTERGCNPTMPLDEPLTRVLERRMAVAFPSSLDLTLIGAQKLELRRVS